MHELAVTQSILEIAVRHAEQQNAAKITDLYLVIGQLSSTVDDSVQFYWDMISDGTIAKGAKLHFKRIPAELACLDCNETFSLTGKDLFCPACSSTRVRVINGNQFFLEAINVEGT
ncbi:MAG: hydrogenase maturation nickel metallochaperone HypA [Chloroflexi bacterium]|nr:MAG: hydrogenase maturation nickel metallochaperone HypA [Chloroflexota bacterium]